jgi:RNA polymerase sigma factor (sigma-70 family)
MTATPPLDPDLDRWLAHFRGPLVGLIASWGAGWALAEELAMDTFAEAWLGRSRFRGATADLDALGPWLRGIAWNLLAAARRRAARQPLPLPDELAAATAVPGTDDPAAERRDLLRAAFALLRPDLQEILRMHYLEATPARTLAALLGITPKAAESRLYQARRALRALADRLVRATAEAGR